MAKFKSENEEINRLVDWVLREFEPKDKRVYVETVRTLSNFPPADMREREIRIREKNNWAQLCFKISGKLYVYPYIKPNNGMIQFDRPATVFKDISTPATSMMKAGVADPGIVTIIGTIDGYGFDAGSDEELFFSIEMPHDWKEGSTIYPHAHWSPTDADTNDVRWGLVTSWANIDDTFPATTTSEVLDAGSGTADDHQYVDFDSIDGSLKTISSIILCRVYREGSHASDEYGVDAVLHNVGFHYEIDTIGSDLENNIKGLYKAS